MLGIVVLAWFQRCGHTPVALVGGATGRVGDPSGKSTERPVLDDATLEANVAGIRGVLARLLREGDGVANGTVVLNNMEWFGGMGLLTFLREARRRCTPPAPLREATAADRGARLGGGGRLASTRASASCSPRTASSRAWATATRRAARRAPLFDQRSNVVR